VPGRHPRVLIAERYDSVRHQVARYLDLHGFLTDQVAGGVEAVSATRATRPALIIAELAMPAGSGRLADRLAEDQLTCHVPVIGLVDVEPPPGQAVGSVAAVLVKPFSLATMLEQIRRVLRHQMQGADR
jgi:DNA-binding response OmpR family regulator